MCQSYEGKPGSGAKCHDYCEEFTMFLFINVIPLGAYTPELTDRCIKSLIARVARTQLNSIAAAPKVNTAGLINLYQDFIFIRNWIREQQQSSKLFSIDNSLGGVMAGITT